MGSEELAAWLRLSLVDGVGNATARRLLAAFGLPDNLFNQSVEALSQVVSARQAAAVLAMPQGLAALTDTTLEWLSASGVGGAHRHVVTLGDPDYPQSLLAMEDPPLMLYLMGATRRLDTCANGIAVVGSRNPTPQGEANAQAFSKVLGAAGLTIVSGLALGVDGAAHRGALEGASADAIATIAVVGTGLDRVYPKRHLALAHAIAERGVLVSEYPLGTPPLSANFPKRNRLIAGLSRGALVVEAALKSGSLITARLAVEQGKDVFAIPGSIHSTQSRGCHALIKQGAKLVETAQDVLEEWGLSVSAALTSDVDGLADAVGAEEKSLLANMGFDPVSLDALVARTGDAAAHLQGHLLELELDGHIVRLPGGLFQRMARG